MEWKILLVACLLFCAVATNAIAVVEAVKDPNSDLPFEAYTGSSDVWLAQPADDGGDPMDNSRGPK